MDYGNTQTSSMNLGMGSATLSQLSFPREGNPNFPWEKSHWKDPVWCFEPSQPQRITLGLNANFTLSPNYSFHKSSYHKSCVFFFSLFIFRGHSTRKPARGQEKTHWDKTVVYPMKLTISVSGLSFPGNFSRFISTVSHLH